MELIFSLHNYECGVVSFAGIKNGGDTLTHTRAHTHTERHLTHTRTLKDKEFCRMRVTAATNGIDMVSSP